eukprot:CAMPEP_0119399726 /NCGR_PEP_ID=MMETSP1334-20130426/141487_1 /TAXON_ID=127549 /ORGANISM="Calcidiscus leptoporus, Strain RCC1130" /LENGTH=126 /DNA_ID=CAMNT_0007423623 /DNA_START=581 /DNA_END=961 /DNA_ORIENTATION=+
MCSDSQMPTKMRSAHMCPLFTIASCASIDETPSKTLPGNLSPASFAMKPAKASMHTRPCLSSASRSQLRSYLSAKPSGSNTVPFTEYLPIMSSTAIDAAPERTALGTRVGIIVWNAETAPPTHMLT